MNYNASFQKSSVLQTIDKDFPQLFWWVKIITAIPSCTYYFGPFDSQEEANIAQYDYIEDLIEEKAKGISSEIVKEQPEILTI